MLMMVDILLNQIQKVHFSSKFEHSAFHWRHKVHFGLGGPWIFQKMYPIWVLFYDNEQILV